MPLPNKSGEIHSHGQPNPNSMSSGIVSTTDSRGLLASGTQNGVVGIAVTDTAHSESFAESDLSRRYNYNLRGHHVKIQRVAWNATMTKLGSCDENGVIYVWVPNEERWSVELVNDRGLKVRDFDWSPNGSAALILYEDNFVLIGSAVGQRIWSNTFLNQVNCGTWSPNSKELVLGLETGQIQVFNDQGTIITERQLLQVGVFKLAFSPIREDEEEHQKWTLAVVSSDDQILFLNTQYEVELYGWKSRDSIRSIHWSSSGLLLAVVCSTGRIVILNHQGRPVHSFIPPIMFDDESMVFTWAHKDEMMVVAAGSTIAVGRVVAGVPALTELVAYQLWLSAGRTGRFAYRLQLPQRPTTIIKQFDRHLIRCRVPSYDKMCRFVCEPTFWRWYCTIMPIPRKSYQYMLCVEHLGGMIPVLIGRQINRVIPQFLISLPPSTAYTTPGYSYGPWAIKDHMVGPRWSYAADCNVNLPMPNYSFTHDLEPMPPSGIEDPSETSGYAQTIAKRKLQEDILLAPQPEPRNSVWRRSKRRIKKFMSKRLANPIVKSNRVLCHVSSNVWCTRFKITSPGIRDLPPTLAHVVYKTSVLHLQPRQMAIALCDLRPLTKNLPLPMNTTLSVDRTTGIRNFRSADSSPAVFRPTDRPRTARGPRTLQQINADSSDDQINNNRPVAPIRPTIMDPILRFEQQQRQLQPIPPQQRQFMTYAETRARLRDRRPIQRVPVAQIQQPDQNQNHQTRRRSRARTLRNHLLRRTDQQQDQQSLLQHAHLDNINEAELLGPRIEEERRVEEIEEARPASPSQEDELVEEERRLYTNVLAEYEGLRTAVDEHIQRMRRFADELKNTKPKLAKRKPEKTKKTAAKGKKEKPKKSTSFADQTDQAVQTEKPRLSWQHKLDSLDFIDEDAKEDSASDEAALLPPHSPPPPPPELRPSTSDSSTSAESKAKKDDIIDRLTALAADLRLRGHRKEAEMAEDQNRLLQDESQPDSAVPRSPSVDDMRAQLRDIAAQLGQLEEAIRTNSMLSDLHQRVQNLKSTLGENPHAADFLDTKRRKKDEDDIMDIQSERADSPQNPQQQYGVIRVANKTPFWNEESQVYQLDFGGRVTQESAKNFQIEHENEQVMQFGRIENGAYTLDFCTPLSAVQAFGIALASITQRLK
ncbi:unnamed protein product [Bursaphelenchus okinawaensis]|uniref:Tub domain-containing protein n=1 Tax=Bursaphelenchus okinawaensis TaxID=465554 RepID=A0A811JQF3_9BILA|nr:unnamed protein product [Bursaphelenchus okinawaensis]CAG9078318.1 unnamed protein product [Bursaphelenchus okinawaensis]